ncbi:protein farnesyltransferase/geranylgeranyltransferase type-1 subunit alpha-like [Primulina huaijiensis]|uniref:protein farnesyltransferase/geranylgeranyltransferase type-1 subunit alpha-like n=1 Tax=Primulina huaijiensis TaxID=1492673 RepID=UPI003CC7743D
MSRKVKEESCVRVPICQRPEWSDVCPVPQDDGPNPIVPIAYAEEFREIMDYFRAVYLADERSPRALQLTQEAVSLNSGNYTVWQFRRVILEALNVDLHEEMDFVARIIRDNAKNYLIWHHRRWIARKFGADVASKELEITKEVLFRDAKNYHAWSHRQWVLQELGGWDEELAYCDELLEDDIFNDSAWNQRYFVVTRSPLLGGLEAMKDSEVAYAVKAILAKPENESSWRYLRALHNNSLSSLSKDPRVASVFVNVLKSKKDYVEALNLVLDLLCRHYEPSDELKNSIDAISPDSCPPGSSVAQKVCHILQVADPMRADYWEWRHSVLV